MSIFACVSKNGNIQRLVNEASQCKNKEIAVAWGGGSPTVDTNAGTICGTGQLLDGDGNCVPIPVDTNTQRTDAEIQAVVGPHTVDTLSNLNCGSGQVAKSNGAAMWSCQDDTDTDTQRTDAEILAVVGPDKSGPVLVIQDSLGAPVGRIPVDLETIFAGVGALYVVIQVDVEGLPRTFALEVNESGFLSGSFGTQDNAWSEDDVCGEPLFKVPDNKFGLERAFVWGGRAYVSQSPSAGEVFIQAKSRRNSFTGTCFEHVPQNVGPVLPTHSTDVSGIYTPPMTFTLDLGN